MDEAPVTQVAPVESDEALKARVTGGPDGHRNGQAFDMLGDVAGSERPALRHFYRPSREDLDVARDQATQLLRRRAHVIIPMRERKPVVRGVLSYLMSRVDPDKVVVVNCNSTDEAIGAVVPFLDRGVKLVHHDEVLDVIDWSKLLPVLGLTERPREGKGITVLAGMLAMYLRYPNAQAIIQHDADVREVERYDPLMHLAFPLVANGHEDRIISTKISRPGRGNETTMTARNILWDLSSNDVLPENIRNLARHLAVTLREHKWMLTGEFGLLGKIGYNRPYATGYCEETLIAAFTEACIEYRRNGHTEAIAHVEATHNRLDDANDARKEFRMMDRISRFLIQYAMFGKPLVDWEVDDYTRFNARFGSLDQVARIPTPEDDDAHSGPVIVERTVQDRIIPSVKQLFKGGFIHEDAAEQLRQQLA